VLGVFHVPRGHSQTIAHRLKSGHSEFKMDQCLVPRAG
jgi:hypothetical protein